MAKTKFVKVSVEDRLPDKERQYTVQKKDSGSEDQHYHEMYYYNGSPLNESFWTAYIKYWLQPAPDREDEMKAMLEELVNLKDGSLLTLQDKAKKLLNELKQ